MIIVYRMYFDRTRWKSGCGLRGLRWWESSGGAAKGGAMWGVVGDPGVVGPR